MIGDYEKVGWSTENPVPLTGYNLQKVDEKLDEIDKHLLSINTLSGVLQGPPGITVPNIHELEQLNEDLQQSDELIVYDTSSDSHKKTSITDVFSLVDTIYVKETNYKDIDVLNKIKNVDGDGSGLNADLLDGYHASTGNSLPNTIPIRDGNRVILGPFNGTLLSLTNTINGYGYAGVETRGISGYKPAIAFSFDDANDGTRDWGGVLKMYDASTFHFLAGQIDGNFASIKCKSITTTDPLYAVYAP